MDERATRTQVKEWGKKVKEWKIFFFIELEILIYKAETLLA